LIHEASRAELRSGGLFIDLGTPDQHKYIRGGYRNNWGDFHLKGGETFIDAREGASVSYYDWQGGITAVILKARSSKQGQRLALNLNGEDIGERHLSQSWTNVAFPLSSPTGPGRVRLFLRFAVGGAGETVAQVQGIWLKTRGRKHPGPARVAVRTFGDPRRSLAADPPRTFSYYLEVPPRSALVFGYAAKKPTDFKITASADGKPPKKLLSATSADGRWKEGRIDLGDLAGLVVRLDYTTHGEGGPAAWAEPGLVGKGPGPQNTPILPGQRARNLIHILVDAARHDVHSIINPTTPVRTPSLTKLSRTGVVFTQAYTNTNWTPPSVASIWSGRYVSSLLETPGTLKVKRLPQSLLLLSEHLQKNGFTTAAFVANPFISEQYGFKQGWDHFSELFYDLEPGTNKGINAADGIYHKAIQWLKRRKEKGKRFYLYLHTMDPHEPYRYHPQYTKQYFGGPYSGWMGKTPDTGIIEKRLAGGHELTGDELRYLQALYYGEVSFHDFHLGGFIRELEELKLMETTMVVYTNDHGEELFDHGNIGHGRTLYDELIRCPLVIRFPQLFPPGKKCSTPVELVDLVPTQLEALGVAPMPGSQGMSLLNVLRGQTKHGMDYVTSGCKYQERRYRAVRLGPFKLIRGKERLELYNLSWDPGEQENLNESHPVALRACEIRLGEGRGMPDKKKRLLGMMNRKPPSHNEPLQTVRDPKLLKRLKALGYTQ